MRAPVFPHRAARTVTLCFQLRPVNARIVAAERWRWRLPLWGGTGNPPGAARNTGGLLSVPCMQLEVIRCFMPYPGACECAFHMLLCVCRYTYRFSLDATFVLPRLKCTLHLLMAIWQGFVSFSLALKPHNLAFFCVM